MKDILQIQFAPTFIMDDSSLSILFFLSNTTSEFFDANELGDSLLANLAKMWLIWCWSSSLKIGNEPFESRQTTRALAGTCFLLHHFKYISDRVFLSLLISVIRLAGPCDKG